jgi:hypothetical protein
MWSSPLVQNLMIIHFSPAQSFISVDGTLSFPASGSNVIACIVKSEP